MLLLIFLQFRVKNLLNHFRLISFFAKSDPVMKFTTFNISYCPFIFYHKVHLLQSRLDPELSHHQRPGSGQIFRILLDGTGPDSPLGFRDLPAQEPLRDDEPDWCVPVRQQCQRPLPPLAGSGPEQREQRAWRCCAWCCN